MLTGRTGYGVARIFVAPVDWCRNPDFRKMGRSTVAVARISVDVASTFFEAEARGGGEVNG
jgi:hypothetical protein